MMTKKAMKEIFKKNTDEVTFNKELDLTASRYQLDVPGKNRLNERFNNHLSVKSINLLIQETIKQTFVCGNTYCSVSEYATTCPTCGNKPDIVFNFTVYKTVEKHNTQLFSRYYEVPRFTRGFGKHLSFSIQSFTLETDLKTGNTLFTGGVGFKKHLHESDEIIPVYQNKLPVQELTGSTRWADLFRNIYSTTMVDYDLPSHLTMVNPMESYVTFKEAAVHEHLFKRYFQQLFALRGITYRSPGEFLSSKEHLLSGFMVIKYPILQHLPFTVFAKLPEEVRKGLRKCYTSQDVWELVFPTCTPGIRKLIHENEGKAALYQMYAPHIQHNHNMLMFLKNGHQASIAGLFMFERPEFHLGMKLITSQFTEEKHWIRQLEEMRKKQNDAEIISYISDIGNMYQTILEAKADFTVLEPNITRLHDRLVRNRHRYSKKNRLISLTKREETFEESVHDFSFYLPKETFELIEAGETFSNCVASYDDRAVNKRCTIVLVKHLEQPVVCIELRQNTIVQAKTFHNKRPNTDQRQIIKEWATRHHIEMSTADLQEPVHILPSHHVDPELNVNLFRHLIRF